MAQLVNKSKIILNPTDSGNIPGSGGIGDITGNGAATQVAVFDAAKNIVGYVPLKFLKAASAAIREQLILGSTTGNANSGAFITVINPTNNPNLTTSGFQIVHSDGTADFLILQFPKNYASDDGLLANGYFGRSASARRRSVMFANAYPILFSAPEFLFGIPTYNATSIGARLKVSEGLRLGRVADMLGDTTDITATLDLSGIDEIKAPLRLREKTEITSNIYPGNIEYINGRLKVSCNNDLAGKKEVAYSQDFESGLFSSSPSGNVISVSNFIYQKINNTISFTCTADISCGVANRGGGLTAPFLKSLRTATNYNILGFCADSVTALIDIKATSEIEFDTLPTGLIGIKTFKICGMYTL